MVCLDTFCVLYENLHSCVIMLVGVKICEHTFLLRRTEWRIWKSCLEIDSRKISSDIVLKINTRVQTKRDANEPHYWMISDCNNVRGVAWHTEVILHFGLWSFSWSRTDNTHRIAQHQERSDCRGMSMYTLNIRCYWICALRIPAGICPVIAWTNWLNDVTSMSIFTPFANFPSLNSIWLRSDEWRDNV